MATTSTRYRIYEQIVTALDTIATTTYHTTPTILRCDPPEPGATGGPWIVVGMGEEEFGEMTAGGRHTVVWRLKIDGYVVKGSGYVQDLFNLSQDIRDAIIANRSTITAEAASGGQAIMVRPAGGEFGEGLLHETGGLAQIIEYVEITYKTQRAF